jgi:hypothetical protein
MTSKEKSVILLQRLWLNKFKSLTTFNIIKHYLLEGITISHVQTMGFDSLLNFIRSKIVISTSKACLKRIHLLCILRHGFSNEFITPNIRIFISGFMIAYYPTDVFKNIGTLESKLIKTSISLLETFDKICEIIYKSDKHCFQDVPNELTKDFCSMLFLYLKYFKEWKAPNTNKLLCRIKHSLIQLYQVEKTISEDSISIKEKIHINIMNLRNKLKEHGGLEELKKFDEYRQLNTSLDVD